MKGRNYRGFTLMELLISVGILAAILSIGIVFIRSSTQDFQYVSKEYTVQNAVRSSVDNIGNVIKEATAIFTVGKNKFDPEDPSKMTDGWSYIGLSQDKTRLINYVWIWTDVKNKKGIRKEIDITPSEWNIRDKDNKKIEYQIGFYRDEEDHALKPEEEEELRSRKMVRMSVKGTVKGTEASYSLSNDILAENLNQIMDSKDRTKNEPITALAYKVDALEDLTPASKGVEAAFVFVVDISGSMYRNMNGGYNPHLVSEQRISILKRNVSKFVEELEKAGTIDLYFVPFSEALYGNVSSSDQTQLQDIYASGHPGYANRLKTVADEILNLYKDLAWGEPLVEKEAKLAIDKLEKELKELKKTNLSDEDKRKAVKAVSESCLQLLQLPFSLGSSVPGQPSAQAKSAQKYIEKRLSPGGDTNVGGGIREGYKLLQKSPRKKKFLMVLSDGQPNIGEYTNSSLSSFYPAPKKQIAGELSEIEIPFRRLRGSVSYIQRVMSSSYGMNVKNPDGSYFIERTFLVGFSAVPRDKTMMETRIPGFSQAGGGTRETKYMDAGDEASLASHFKEVVETVQQDIWYFEGP